MYPMLTILNNINEVVSIQIKIIKCLTKITHMYLSVQNNIHEFCA